MNKKILIILLVFLTFGCSKVEYNLTVKNDKIVEEIVIPFENNSENKKELDDLIKTKQTSYYSAINNKNYYYTTTIEESDDKKDLLLKYKYDFSKNNIINSEAINGCFYDKNIINTSDKFIIETGEISCLRDEYGQIVDEVIVNIKVDFKVIDNNADEVKDNTYTWRFNNDNYTDKYIYLETNNKIEKNKKIDLSLKTIIIIISVIFGISLVIFIYMFLKNQKNNKI